MSLLVADSRTLQWDRIWVVMHPLSTRCFVWVSYNPLVNQYLTTIQIYSEHLQESFCPTAMGLELMRFPFQLAKGTSQRHQPSRHSNTSSLSQDRGFPQGYPRSIWIGCSIINHPIWGIPHFRTPPSINRYAYHNLTRFTIMVSRFYRFTWYFLRKMILSFLDLWMEHIPLTPSIAQHSSASCPPGLPIKVMSQWWVYQGNPKLW
jgi:hypothetical protein